MLFYMTYYVLDITMGALVWTTQNLYHGVSYFVTKKQTRDEKIDEYVMIEDVQEIKKEIKELRKLMSKRIFLEG
jgi:hypothetical protein